MESCWSTPAEDHPWVFYLTNGKRSCYRNKYLAKSKLNSSGQFCQCSPPLTEKKILEWKTLAKLLRCYNLFYIYGRKKQLYLSSIVGFPRFLVCMSLHRWESCTDCSFLMLHYLVSKFTAALETSSIVTVSKGKMIFQIQNEFTSCQSSRWGQRLTGLHSRGQTALQCPCASASDCH